MDRLRKFLCLDWQERRLLLQTVLLLLSLRAALWLMPFKQVHDFLARRAKQRATRRIARDRVISAVRAASAVIPGSTCLAQTLAGKYQLERFGFNTRLHLGVTKENGRLLAHAWLECEGEPVIGGEIASRYAPLLALN
jgi:hypothetical protein